MQSGPELDFYDGFWEEVEERLGEKEANLQVLNARRASRSDDEQRYHVPEDMDEVALACELLLRSESLQQKCGFNMVRQILCKDRPPGAAETQTLLSAMCQFLSTNAVASMSILAAEVLTEILANECLNIAVLVESAVLPLAIKFLRPGSSSEVLERWEPVLAQCLELISLATVEQKLLPIILTAGGSTESADQRLLCAHLLLPLLGRSPQLLLGSNPSAEGSHSGSLMSIAMGLCQDTDRRVRASLGRDMAGLAAALQADGRSSHAAAGSMAWVVKEVVELLRDEEKDVRSAATRGAMELLPLVPPSLCVTLLHSVQCDIYDKFLSSPSDVESLAQHIGPLLVQISSTVASDAWDHKFYAGAFHTLSSGSSDEAQRHCAFNLPAVVQVLSREGHWGSIQESITALCVAPQATVRVAAARALGAVGQVLGDQHTCSFLLPIVLAQLDEKEDPRVRHALVESSLGQLLPPLLAHGPDDAPGEARSRAMVERLDNLMGTLLGKHQCWRQELALVEAIHLAVDRLPVPAGQSPFVPGLFRIMALSCPQVHLSPVSY